MMWKLVSDFDSLTSQLPFYSVEETSFHIKKAWQSMRNMNTFQCKCDDEWSCDELNTRVVCRDSNPQSSVQRPHRKVNNDPTLRIQNLSILVQQIKSYYQVSGTLTASSYSSNGSHDRRGFWEDMTWTHISSEEPWPELRKCDVSDKYSWRTIMSRLTSEKTFSEK